jgi:uncharacterized damage-inducible protein DinB
MGVQVSLVMGGHMQEVQRIEDQLKRAFEGNAWHGPSVRELLADMRAERALAKPLANVHSIWEIVLHMAAWERVVRRRLAGEDATLSPEEDWPPVQEASEIAWKTAGDSLEKDHQELRSLIGRLSDAQLQAPVVGRHDSVYHMVHGVIQHDLYHAGQIAILKKG